MPQQAPHSPARQEAPRSPQAAAPDGSPGVAVPEVVGGAADIVPVSEEPTESNHGRHLDEAFEITRKYKTKRGGKDGWQCDKTVDQARKALNLFMRVTGLTHESQVTRDHVLEFRSKVGDLPAMKGRSIYSGMGDLEQIKLADEMEDLSVRARNGDEAAQRIIVERLEGRKTTIEDVCARIGIATINRYLSQLAAIFDKPLGSDGQEAHHPAFLSVQYKREKGKKGQVKPTRILRHADLEAIFATPKFQNEYRKKSERFWGLMLMGLQGVRRGEVAQFIADDFDLTKDVPTLSLEHATKKLKTETSERTLPVHPLTIELGLKEIVQKALKHKRQDLFPSFAWKANEMECGRDLTRWFADVLDEAGVRAPGKSLKSLRMGFNTDLTRKGCNDAGRHYLMGHAHAGVNLEHYFGGFRPKDLAEHITGTCFEEVARRCLLNEGRNDGNVVEFLAAA